MNTAEFRTLRWADYFIFALTDPSALYRLIRGNQPAHLILGFSVPAAVAVVEIVTVSLLGSETDFFYYKISYGWIMMFFYSVLKIVVAASLMDMMAQLLGYSGSVREKVSIINFSLLPGVFLLPAVYIFRVIHFAVPFFYIFFSMLLFVWSCYIAIRCIAEMHDSGFARALLIFVFPYIFVGVILFFILVLSIFYALGYLAG